MTKYGESSFVGQGVLATEGQLKLVPHAVIRG